MKHDYNTAEKKLSENRVLKKCLNDRNEKLNRMSQL